VAEHQEALQLALLVQALESQEGAEGFAGTGAGVDQHIAAALLQAAPQQLDQLNLPLAGR
jgi:hypothetical protein